ncbi:MAG: hypothetical protein ABI901_05050 [Roseiflexaceae bacterium]
MSNLPPQTTMLVTAPPIEERIADWLAQLLGPTRPRRISRMYNPGTTKRQKNKQGEWETVERGKYEDVPRHVQLDRAKLLRHVSGDETWAVSLECGRIGVATTSSVKLSAGCDG